MSPEFSLINEHILPRAGHGQGVILGIGDDAALVVGCGDREQVLAMDTLVAGRHFFADQAGYDVGWKALAVNLSDLASMGAVPRYALLSLSLPDDDRRTAWVAEFMRGWRDLATAEQVALIGGDTTSSPVLSISVTVIGGGHPVCNPVYNPVLTNSYTQVTHRVVHRVVHRISY